MNNNNHYDAIVIGAGPAGLSAGIYLSRARVKTLIINEGVAGGQMILTHEIANYPGVESISGYQLSNIMKKQAQSFGCDIMTNVSVSNLSLAGELKTVELTDGTSFTSHAIILAPGGRPRTVGVTGEDDFKGRGISYCATCDGDFFTDKEIIVVGGGNSALEEAVSLTKYASKVTIVHQFDHFQAFEHAVEEAGSNPKINFIMESAVVAFYGNEKLESVDIKNLKSEEITNFKTEGAFVFIGYVPNTGFIKDKANLNQWGEIVVKNDMSTSIEGVYAAGDSTAKRFRQVTTAVSDGTIAALASANYLNELKIRQKQQILA
jgi:thioredoxin reductase (NADPH)